MSTTTFKKGFLVLSILIILTSTLLISPKIRAVEEHLPKLVFPVISDIHIGELGSDKKFENALVDYNSYSAQYIKKFLYLFTGIF